MQIERMERERERKREGKRSGMSIDTARKYVPRRGLV